MAFIKVKIAKKKIPKKKVINIVINITQITNRIGSEWFCVELQEIYDTYRIDPTMKKLKLKNILKSLKNMQTAKKVEYFNTMPEDITEKEFVQYLRVQTLGADFVNYDYLVRYYNIELDDNLMPIFTEEFQFDNKIKKEALFVWNILVNIKKDKHLRNLGQEYFKLDLQSKIESDEITELRKMSFDMHFTLLDIIIEIDENHINVGENDDIKNCIMQQNGILYKRMDFQKIYTGEICNNANANIEILNNTYYTEFIKNLVHALLYKLLKQSNQIREYFVMYLFKNVLIDKYNRLIYLVENSNNTKTLLNIELNLSVEKNKILERIKSIDNNINTHTESWRKVTTQINNLLESSNFINMFALKDRCKRSIEQNLTDKVITFDEVVNLLEISDSNMEKFHQFLLGSLIIEDINEINEDEKILLNWKQVSMIITTYGYNNNVKSLLQLYFNELEDSYESIIHIFNSYTISAKEMQNSYKVCMTNASIKIENDIKHAAILEATNIIKYNYNKKLKSIANENKYYKNIHDKAATLERLQQSENRSFTQDLLSISETEHANNVLRMTAIFNNAQIDDTENNAQIDDTENNAQIDDTENIAQIDDTENIAQIDNTETDSDSENEYEYDEVK